MAQLLMMFLLSLSLASIPISLLAQAAKPPASHVPVSVHLASILTFRIELDLAIETYDNLYAKLSSSHLRG
jgi:hypothetical protein